MSVPIISVENLGKCYRIRHQSERQRYVTLRDVLASRARSSARRFGSIFRATSASSRSLAGAREEDFWALKSVSFEVKPGEVVGVIGQNGAGKSTLLKILSRITQPSQGRVCLGGRVASMLEVGTGFHPELTGRENIFLNGAILGMTRSEIRTRFDEIVSFAEVDRFLDTPVKRYSSGMYVRLAFAVAAHLEPEILVVDEVLAVGDLDFQKKCLGKMATVAHGGRTILFVSHNMSAVRSLCHRCIVIKQGRLQLDGDVHSTIEAYSAKGQFGTNLAWSVGSRREDAEVQFCEIRANTSGRQPEVNLECDLHVQIRNGAPSCFISVDICDAAGFPLMQALPSPVPFTLQKEGVHRVLLTIELPPMIPGFYSADFWIGPHFSETLHYQKAAITFEINESPTAGRTFPHYRDHGQIVPKSTIHYIMHPI